MPETRTVKTDVVLPALQALVSGLILGVACWAIASLAGIDRSWAYGVGAWAFVTTLAWLLLLRRSLQLVEQLLGVDLDRDGFIGEPAIVEPVTRVDLVDNNSAYPGGQFLALPVDRVRMVAISLELERGASFSHSLAGPSKALTRGEYERLRDYLLREGLLRWNSDYSRKEGLALTGKGRALVRGFASMAASEIPTLASTKNSKQSELVEYTHSTHRAHREEVNMED